LNIGFHKQQKIGNIFQIICLVISYLLAPLIGDEVFGTWHFLQLLLLGDFDMVIYTHVGQVIFST